MLKFPYKNWYKKIKYDKGILYLDEIPFSMKEDEFKKWIKGKEKMYKNEGKKD